MSDNNKALKRKMSPRQRSPHSRRRVESHLVGNDADPCDSAFQTYILSLTQKLALKQASAKHKADCDDQLCVMEEGKNLNRKSILIHKNIKSSCEALQQSSISFGVSKAFSSLHDDVAKQGQALSSLVESVNHVLSHLPCQNIRESPDKIVEALHDVKLDCEADIMFEDASDNLLGIIESQSKIEEEYKSLEHFPHEASQMIFTGINYSTNNF